jgi:hypothetical protein
MLGDTVSDGILREAQTAHLFLHSCLSDWDMFRQLSEVNQKLITGDYEVLASLYCKSICSENITPLQRCGIERLQAVE